RKLRSILMPSAQRFHEGTCSLKIDGNSDSPHFFGEEFVFIPYNGQSLRRGSKVDFSRSISQLIDFYELYEYLLFGQRNKAPHYLSIRPNFFLCKAASHQ
ncbi:hypothetical protein CEXT_157521, partial [Caerostris extrusa]